MMLQEAGHILGLSHPDKIQPLTFSRATATSEAVMFPTGSNHHLSAPCGPNPWALMVPGVPDGAELDPRTGVRPAAMATMQRGNGNRYRCLQPDDLEGLNAFYPPECTGAHAPGVTPTIVCPTFEHEAEFVSSGGTEGDSGSSSMGVIIGGTGEHRPCHPAPARTPPVLPQTYHPATTLLILRRASRAPHTVGGLLALCCCCIGIGGGVFFYMKQKKASSSTNTATELATAPQQIAVIVSQPGAPAKQAAAPQSLAALLAACGLEHRAQAFEDEGYTLDILISSLKQGEQVAKSDLRELKLTLGECRELITKLQDSM